MQRALLPPSGQTTCLKFDQILQMCYHTEMREQSEHRGKSNFLQSVDKIFWASGLKKITVSTRDSHNLYFPVHQHTEKDIQNMQTVENTGHCGIQ